MYVFFHYNLWIICFKGLETFAHEIIFIIQRFSLVNLFSYHINIQERVNIIVLTLKNEVLLCFRLLSDAVFNFPNTQEEITLSVSPDATVLKNYTDDEPGTII